MVREQDLYEPVKVFLEGQGYDVKAEVNACDIVARRADEPPIVVELKTRFNLELVLQAVDRLRVASLIYVAFPDHKKGSWRSQRRRILKLCKMLGIGIILVRNGRAYAALDPAVYTPRQQPAKKARLLKEFAERVGDPNTGGVSRRRLITAYRQDALRLVCALAEKPDRSPATLKDETGVERAGAILHANHYGWFERVSRGVYRLSPKGEDTITVYAGVIDEIVKNASVG